MQRALHRHCPFRARRCRATTPPRQDPKAERPRGHGTWAARSGTPSRAALPAQRPSALAPAIRSPPAHGATRVGHRGHPRTIRARWPNIPTTPNVRCGDVQPTYCPRWPIVRWAAVVGMGLGVGAAVCAARAAGWLEWADLRLYDAGIAARAERAAHAAGHAGADPRGGDPRSRPPAARRGARARARADRAGAAARDRRRPLPRRRRSATRPGARSSPRSPSACPGLVFVEKLPEPGLRGRRGARVRAQPRRASASTTSSSTPTACSAAACSMLWDAEGQPEPRPRAPARAAPPARRRHRARARSATHPEHLRLGATSFPPLEAARRRLCRRRRARLPGAARSARGPRRVRVVHARRRDRGPRSRRRAARSDRDRRHDRAEREGRLPDRAAGRTVPGIAVHAHLADQLVRWAHGRSRPLRFWSEAGEAPGRSAGACSSRLVAAAARRVPGCSSAGVLGGARPARRRELAAAGARASGCPPPARSRRRSSRAGSCWSTSRAARAPSARP